MKRHFGFVLLVAAALVATGCGGDDNPATDGGITLDGGPEAGMDATVTPDTGPDAPVGDPSCRYLGNACAGGVCGTGYECAAPQETTVAAYFGEAVTDLPADQATLPVAFLSDGYCYELGCLTAADSSTACGDCGTCVNDGDTGLCLEVCTPSITDRGGCRDGYECNIFFGGCWVGCSTDAECRISRRESNGIPGLQDSDDCVGDDTRAPADQVCGGDPANFDNLVYDPAGGTCDPNTNSCVHDGTAGAEAGTACTLDTECEASGTCFADWGAAGTCSKFGCELAGNECAGAGVCHERRFGIGACVTGCQVASDADPADEATWLTSNGGCGDGFACYWDGISAAGAAVNGGCYGVDEPSTVTVNNLGDACLTDADCYSPFGFGRCLSEENYGFPGGFCFLDDCLAPGVPGTVCGAGNQCVDLDGTSGNATACFPGCTTADDCRPGYACLDLDGNPATANSACWISCSDSTECHFNEFCNPEGTCAPLCGNGVVDTTAGETCDSRGADTMACDADCTAPACGDGHTNRPAGEICDDGNTVDECPYGSVDCVGCAADCSAPIVGAYCGDGATDTADGETCDDGNTIDETACAYGTASCTTCNAACDGDLILTGAICGDGAIDAADGEACDDGNADACGGCTADCTAVSASPTGCAAGVGCTADADCTSGTCDPGTNTCA